MCADFGDLKSRVREANERNNCSRKVLFRAVPRRWNVSTFTTGPNSLVGGAPFFAARADGVTFDFYGIVNDQGAVLPVAGDGRHQRPRERQRPRLHVQR